MKCRLGFALAYIHSVNMTNSVFCLSLVSACSTTVQLLFTHWNSCQIGILSWK